MKDVTTNVSCIYNIKGCEKSVFSKRSTHKNASFQILRQKDAQGRGEYMMDGQGLRDESLGEKESANETGFRNIISDGQPRRFALTHLYPGHSQLSGRGREELHLKRYSRACLQGLVCRQISKDHLPETRYVQPECLLALR